MLVPILQTSSNPDMLLGGDTGNYGGSSSINPMPTNTYTASNSPFGNIKVYDLDAEIQPIPKNNTTTGATVGQNAILTQNTGAISGTITGATIGMTTGGATTGATTTGATTTGNTVKKPNYLLYGGGALLVGFIVYKLFKK